MSPPSPPSRPDTALASHSTATVARRLGVSIPTVQRWVDLGHLKAWKTVGGHRRIAAASVESFMLGREAHDDAAAAALSVLVVDDNPDDRDLLTALAETAWPGATVRAAEGGFAALLCIGQKMPDVLITDIVMPHMNGFEMLRHIATQCASRPRVVVAVSSQTPDRFASLGTLPDDVRFIVKPFDPAQMIAALRQASAATAVAAR